MRGPAGLLAGATRTADLPGRLDDLGRALERYRDTVAGAFTDADGVRLTPEQRARLLERGIVLPDLPAASRARVVPALRDLTERLLDQRLPLRSAAARLASLSDRTAPAGSAARLARLDEVCDPAYLRHLARPPRFHAGGGRAAAALTAGGPAFAAGLWPGPGWYLGPAVGLAAGALGALMRWRRPNRSPDGGRDGGATTRVAARLAGGLAGGAAGAAAGALLGPPAWAGAPLVLLALVAAVVLAVRDWMRSVDAWWRRTDAEYASRVAAGVDRLLAETAVHDWMFADVRHHCSDGARAAALLLRGLAAAADRHGEPTGPGDPSPYGGGPHAGAAHAQAPGAPDGGDPWDWDRWGDSSAGDGWYAAEPAAPGARPPGPPAGTGSVPQDPLAWPADGGQPGAPGHPPEHGVYGAPRGSGSPYGPDAGHGGPPPDAAPHRTGDGEHAPDGYAPPGTRGRHAVHGAGARDGGSGGGDHPWPPPGAAAEPPWLERERGDGGPDLVDTLVADLAAGARDVLTTCWARIERDPAQAGRTPLDAPVRELLDEVYGRLLRTPRRPRRRTTATRSAAPTRPG
ncbi:hypothetical protein [Streptomyces sp. CC228A]|uniref:hypothetical protein n=1 Tax=Streptomyces sp. CC228A TaxID=2898186 RepID=UPI001F1CE71D|nr:hypothetical protein [Streptomyces sp. CC228A]